MNWPVAKRTVQKDNFSDSRPYQDLVGDTIKLNIVAGGSVEEDANWLLTGFYRGLESPRGG